MTARPDLFDKWIKFFFNRPVAACPRRRDPAGEFWQEVDGENCTSGTSVARVTETFLRLVEVLLPYSNAQVNQGLDYILRTYLIRSVCCVFPSAAIRSGEVY